MKEVIQPHGGTLKIPEKGETNNPNGRPKKSFRSINDTLKSKGFEPVTHGQFIEAYCLIFSLDEEAIQELADDDKIPLSIRLIIQDLTNPQTSGKAIQDMRNYVFGTATQKLDLTSKGKELQTVTLFELPKNGRDEGT